MAIYHFTTYTMGRASGHSAVAAAAYRSGSKLVDERTGEIHDFTRKGGVLSAEVVTPQGVPTPERERLWNAAEAAEKRKDARTAREWRLALPYELSPEERKAVAHRMAQAIADRYGVAVDVCIHAPDKEGDDRNFHAHMLATTRRINDDGSLGVKSAIELANKDRKKAGIAGTTQDEIRDLRREWATIANAALEKEGQSVRIDYRSYDEQGVSLTPTRHIGPDAVAIERRGGEAERIDLHNTDRQEQARQIADRPELILDKLTATKAIFDRRDIAAELNRYIDDTTQFQTLLAKLETSPQLLEMESANGRQPARYSTRDMVETERRMADTAQRLSGSGKHGVSVATAQAAIDGAGTLSDEQKVAVRHVTQAGSLAVVIGDAGTGKSFSMKVAREAWEAQGFTVRGAALAGKAADELQAGSGIESRTLASLEYAWKEGKSKLTSRDVLVIDEAGMIGSRQLGRVLEAAEKAGAKVVLLGDHKQLAAIEAGAAFRAVVQHVGASEITEVRRQRQAWAREAGQQFARGSVADGLRAYDERGHVQMRGSREAARKALAAAYVGDKGMGSQIVLAHGNKDVLALNEAIREARKDRGELDGAARFMTERGGREFAAGDRIVFLRNDRDLGVKNGTLGTVERAEYGGLSVRLDNGETRQVNAEQYSAVDHGYAVTIHKAQGVTVDRAYLLATPGMDRSLAYVGMTRHRDSATLFAAVDDFGGKGEDAARVQLARTLGRERPKESTLDFADRRGFDGEGVLWRWIERGRAKVGALAKRAEQAIGRVLERAGRDDQVLTMAAASKPAQAVSTPSAAAPKRKASEIAAEHTKAKAAQAAAAKAVTPQAERDQAKTPQTVDDVREAAVMRLRAELEAQDKNPSHRGAAINRQADEEAIRWVKAQPSQTKAMKPPALSAADTKAAVLDRGRQDEATLQKLLEQRSAERRGRAAAVMARLEKLDDTLSQAYRTHQAARPQEPRGLAAMLGRGQYEKDAAAWQRQGQQLAQRIGEVQRRRRIAGNIARGPMDAQRLAVRKVQREQPELWQRVEAFRKAQQAERAKAIREQVQQQFAQHRDRSQDRSPTR
ncbi:MAG: Ti-type conjugative transfer relaxase TraA [Chiayiivirga sp.]|jgi:Ti-type conjugative transfer relaxase TraA|uniref:Ti-type conjugative transfer relaxase TraA n=1 Tax=Chiayiivirga sp. TaxID=2041042 RepID=UPI0025B9E2CF|nr:Ti-type conjugative transfer relaxase TraA [Chiayiivirga sp.]MCI1728239.1 Ti-type conjugative transfer relaxase TraA [Chiayiivirga sp.]